MPGSMTWWFDKELKIKLEVFNWAEFSTEIWTILLLKSWNKYENKPHTHMQL